jgi:hypothetical protein
VNTEPRSAAEANPIAASRRWSLLSTPVQERVTSEASGRPGIAPPYCRSAKSGTPGFRRQRGRSSADAISAYGVQPSLVSSTSSRARSRAAASKGKLRVRFIDGHGGLVRHRSPEVEGPARALPPVAMDRFATARKAPLKRGLFSVCFALAVRLGDRHGRRVGHRRVLEQGDRGRPCEGHVSDAGGPLGIRTRPRRRRRRIRRHRVR